MKFRLNLAVAMLAACVLAVTLLAGASGAAAQTSPRPPWASPPVTASKGQTLPTRAQTHVYLLRGLFGVFSTGMDSLAKELVSRGYVCEVYGWDEAEKVIAQIDSRHDAGHTGPVVVIGHSLGANAVIQVATAVDAQAIPVALGVTFDATEPAPVPDNVEVFVNFWAKDGFGRPVVAVPGYPGQLENYDLSGVPGIDHTSIDSMDQFHQYIIASLESMTGN
ncbi:alpha/beta hydrolase [Ancylobacter sp. MQZ15Z-1]|uniref:Alpha/beta hydrolase n=1 Tax=Ancylobacter mangrovi TaxID=2972472 RepID=A0A9X2PD73_9HYPH|nr:alpha/beta hydrolase [Ancylobacter mangrovi]MCS0496602.1 alpha/beta hydrolase [Ancylobacter mangrovi]